VEANLIVLSPGKLQGKSIRLGRAPFVIGRDAACHLRPQSGRVSGRHCSVVMRDKHLFIRDLDSAGGTFVDGQRLLHERRLKGGERIQVGPLVFGVSIVHFLSEGDAIPLRGRPLPPEPTDEDAASILLLLAEDQESSEKNLEFSPGDFEGDAPTPAQIAEAERLIRWRGL
jgi:predicted component of type VI protein secretion system